MFKEPAKAPLDYIDSSIPFDKENFKELSAVALYVQDIFGYYKNREVLFHVIYYCILLRLSFSSKLKIICQDMESRCQLVRILLTGWLICKKV